MGDGLDLKKLLASYERKNDQNYGVEELKAFLESRGLAKTGKKEDLINRLLTHENQKVSAGPSPRIQIQKGPPKRPGSSRARPIVIGTPLSYQKLRESYGTSGYTRAEIEKLCRERNLNPTEDKNANVDLLLDLIYDIMSGKIATIGKVDPESFDSFVLDMSYTALTNLCRVSPEIQIEFCSNWRFWARRALNDNISEREFTERVLSSPKTDPSIIYREMIEAKMCTPLDLESWTGRLKTGGFSWMADKKQACIYDLVRSENLERLQQLIDTNPELIDEVMSIAVHEGRKTVVDYLLQSGYQIIDLPRFLLGTRDTYFARYFADKIIDQINNSTASTEEKTAVMLQWNDELNRRSSSLVAEVFQQSLIL